MSLQLGRIRPHHDRIVMRRKHAAQQPAILAVLDQKEDTHGIEKVWTGELCAGLNARSRQRIEQALQHRGLQGLCQDGGRPAGERFPLKDRIRSRTDQQKWNATSANGFTRGPDIPATSDCIDERNVDRIFACQNRVHLRSIMSDERSIACSSQYFRQDARISLTGHERENHGSCHSGSLIQPMF